MRRFLFPLLVLVAAGVLWLMGESRPGTGNEGGQVESDGLSSLKANVPVAAPPAVGSASDGRQALGLPGASTVREGIGPNRGHLLTLGFRASRPETLDQVECRLRLLGDWDEPDPAPSRLDKDYEVEFRVPPGQLKVLLIQNGVEIEIEVMEMPARDLYQEIRLGELFHAAGRILLDGGPVSARVSLFGIDDYGEEVGFLEMDTDSDGRWSTGLLPREPTFVRVRARVPGFRRQALGPFPLLPRQETTIELPFAWLVVAVDPGLGVEGMGIFREPLPGDPASWRDLWTRGLEDCLVDGFERLRIGPCRFHLEGVGNHKGFVGEEGDLRAGELRMVRLAEVPSGWLQVGIGKGRAIGLASRIELVPKDPAGRRFTPVIPSLSPRLFPMEVQFRVTPGDWEVRVHGPVVEFGSSPPRYFSDPGEIWRAELAIAAGQVRLLWFQAGESSKPEWRVVPR